MEINKKDNPFYDPSLGIEEKLDLLVKELTLDEKFNMLASGSDGVERLGIPDCRLGGEAAHGVEARNDQNRIGEPDLTTSFPQPIGMSASWDKEAIKAAGRIVGKESRIDYHIRKWGGISRWAPTIDLLRDPRWGRNEEAYGEDPVQVGAMASSYIRGIQGDDKDHLTAASTLKHFYANNAEIGRGWKNSSISPRNKYELYMEPFRRCIEDGGAEGVMTAYNRINGVQGLFNEEVRTLLKDEFGLTHAVSDGGAMELSAAYSHATAMDAETAARSIKAGVDALSGRPAGVYAAVSEAYELGLLTDEDLDTAIKNVYRTKIRLGLFEEEKEDLGELCSEEAKEACKDLTDRSTVLLKNDGILPLDKETLSDCVLIGPVGDKWYQDWYGGEAPEHISLYDGINNILSGTGKTGEIPYTDGCDRICLKYKNKYIAAGADGRMKLSDTPEIFVLEDWGEDSFSLRCELTGKYMIARLAAEVTEGIAVAEEAGDEENKVAGVVFANADRIFSWFDLEVFRMSKERNSINPIEETVIRDRFGNRLYADAEGYIVSATGDQKGLTPLSFSIETLRDGVTGSVEAAKKAGTVILALGHHPMINAKEEVDRSTIGFIPYQQKLFDEIYKVNRNIVVVLMTDYPFAINEINETARAILWSATGSQCMGQSLAEALIGEVHPAGRLTQTWFKSDSDLPDIDDYDIIAKGRTYRYFEGDVLYPFGYGLTYTTFEYNGLKAAIVGEMNSSGKAPEDKTEAKKKIPGQPSGVYDNVKNDGRKINVEIDVANTGDAVSDEVVQIYAKAPQGRTKKPVKQLIGFERVRDIKPGETRHLHLEIPIRELAYYDVISESLIIEGGSYKIEAGSSSLDIKAGVSVNVDGVKYGLRDTSKKIKADHYDEESGTQIVEGLYGYSALTGISRDVYEPRADAHMKVTYSDCKIPKDATALRIHGIAPLNATLKIYIDDSPAGRLSLNTREYEMKNFEARNHMPRAALDENMRKRSWPLLWADIRIPLDLDGIDVSEDKGHVIRIETDGAFKYDWFSLI
ncbi:MAG: glycoside hydrolase family 3 C-terminal domain-containing protein [Lachnospiraceae bacterium]|nr:glycoside hydrolase family 3 C-terminal domain-containing protein [Lachnospiraceae bacterium]